MSSRFRRSSTRRSASALESGAVWTALKAASTAAAASWIYAGGPHHTVFSQALPNEPIEDLAEMLAVECVRIDGRTQLSDTKNQLRWNQAYYRA